jgi:hypothetical protein
MAVAQITMNEPTMATFLVIKAPLLISLLYYRILDSNARRKFKKVLEY